MLDADGSDSNVQCKWAAHRARSLILTRFAGVKRGHARACLSRRTTRRVGRVQYDGDSDAPLMQSDSLLNEAKSRVEQRRVVLVPQDAEGTPDSIHDREPPPKCQAPWCRRCLQVRGQFEGAAVNSEQASVTVPASSGESILHQQGGVRRAGTQSRTWYG